MILIARYSAVKKSGRCKKDKKHPCLDYFNATNGCHSQKCIFVTFTGRKRIDDFLKKNYQLNCPLTDITMKICAAQVKPIKGDIETNIAKHKKLIALAVANKANMIMFPELSITGYEPALARELSTGKDDKRFNEFQIISDSQHITIGVGMPVKGEQGVLISMIIFQPGKDREIYCKQYLHSDEYSFFCKGTEALFLNQATDKVALSICYELSVPEHSAHAYENGANIYFSSVAKSVDGVEKAVKTLSALAKQYSMTVIMSNCTGYCDNFLCGGHTSAWNDEGELIGQLDESGEGILIVDTLTREVLEKMLPDK